QVFSLHLAAAMPACTQYQEWSIETTPWTQGVYEPALRVVDGRVDAPTAPGWGVQLDQAFVREAELTTSAV
ncbi:MAG TPA: enolase C-terminal domain-like protein, partial [Pseudonocardia sp.]